MQKVTFTFNNLKKRNPRSFSVKVTLEEGRIKKPDFIKQRNLVDLKGLCDNQGNAMSNCDSAGNQIEVIIINDVGLIGNYTIGYCQFSVKEMCKNKFPEKP